PSSWRSVWTKAPRERSGSNEGRNAMNNLLRRRTMAVQRAHNPTSRDTQGSIPCSATNTQQPTILTHERRPTLTSYRSQYTDSDEVRFGKHLVLWAIVALALVSLGGWFFTRSTEVADNAIVHYEEFEEIHATCTKIDADLATIRAVPEGDAMFSSFSKA